jgi:hypothetical protein
MKDKSEHMLENAFHAPTISNDHRQHSLRLCDKGGGSGGLVAPGGGQDTDGLVVAGQTVDAGLDQNEAELGVSVLAVALEVLADSDGLERRMRLVRFNY